MKVSVVIPRHKEGAWEIFPLLASIGGQVGIDLGEVEVIIVSDGGAVPLEQGFVSEVGALTGLAIDELVMQENVGPGICRQTGMDAANGEWVMCCDADDRLQNVGVLGALLQTGEREGADIVSSNWLEESVVPETGQLVYIQHEQESTWMHGKLIRTSFIRENSIRHHPDLRVHEDSYFLSVATGLTEKRVHVPTVTYVWKYGADSITRRDGAAYSWDSMPTFVRACTLAMEELERRDVRGELPYKTVQLVLYLYYVLHSDEWAGHEAECRAVEEVAAECLGHWMPLYAAADPQMVAEVAASERQRTYHGGPETETVREWIGRIGVGYWKMGAES